jgi:hypothetical protein
MLNGFQTSTLVKECTQERGDDIPLKLMEIELPLSYTLVGEMLHVLAGDIIHDVALLR